MLVTVKIHSINEPILPIEESTEEIAEETERLYGDRKAIS